MNNIQFTSNTTQLRSQKQRYYPIKMGLLISVLIILQYSCANIVTPTGGPKDETPPQLVAERSTPNFSTNFKEEKIILTFNEWLKLDDVFKQVIISPPFEKKEIYLRKKSVVVDLSEVELKDSATYTINFGKSVKDLTEGNVVEDLRFVFSTGPYIDSLELEGKLIDALTNEPAKEVLIMLYDNTDDSVIYKDLPFYFATTDESGQFKIRNIKEGKFKVFALKDADLNYFFNQETEQIGFLDTLLTMDINDTVAESITLPIFTQLPDFDLVRTLKEPYGHIRFVFTQELKDSLTAFDYFPIDNNLTSYIEYEKDTLHFWYNDTVKTRSFIISRNNFIDTIDVKSPNQADFLAEQPFVKLLKPNNPKVKQNPSKQILLKFNHPIANFEIDSILFLVDTLKKKITPKINYDPTSRRLLMLTNQLKEGMPYELTFLPNALEDMFGLTNKDTITINYNTQLKKDFGNVNITATGLDSMKSYVISLLTDKGVLIKDFQTQYKTTFKTTIKAINPAQYQLRVIEDTNQNGRWDPGLYPNRQPEKVFNSTSSSELRANWDLDIEIQLNDDITEQKIEEEKKVEEN